MSQEKAQKPNTDPMSDADSPVSFLNLDHVFALKIDHDGESLHIYGVEGRRVASISYGRRDCSGSECRAAIRRLCRALATSDQKFFEITPEFILNRVAS